MQYNVIEYLEDIEYNCYRYYTEVINQYFRFLPESTQHPQKYITKL